MCEFCDKIEEKEICSYSNNAEFGIRVYSQCYMKGNMLAVGGYGNRWTKSDYYYESEGLDVDVESAVDANTGIAKIKFCPFCGKKLTDKTYENEVAKRELPLIEKDLALLNKYKNYYGAAFRTQEYDKDITKLKDKATIFIPVFSSKMKRISHYKSSSRSIYAFDYDAFLPFLYSEWELKHCIPYEKNIFMNLDEKEFVNSFFVHKRDTAMLMFNSVKQIEDLLESIGNHNIKWKWNKKNVLNDVNKFHNDVINQIQKLENRKSEIENSIK